MRNKNNCPQFSNSGKRQTSSPWFVLIKQAQCLMKPIHLFHFISTKFISTPSLKYLKNLSTMLSTLQAENFQWKKNWWKEWKSKNNIDMIRIYTLKWFQYVLILIFQFVKIPMIRLNLQFRIFIQKKQFNFLKFHKNISYNI